MSDDVYQDIEMDLQENTPLTLPFSVIRVCQNPQECQQERQSHQRLAWWLYGLMIVVLMGVGFVDDGWEGIISAYWVLLFLSPSFVWGLRWLHTTNKKILPILANIPERSVVLVVDNTSLTIHDEFSEVHQSIALENLIYFKEGVGSYSTNGVYLDIVYRHQDKKVKLDKLFYEYGLYHFYVQINGNKYKVTRKEIRKFITQIIDGLKENPNAKEIPFDKRLFINEY